MFVCICRQVTDREIRQAAEIGVADFGELQSSLGVGAQCGKCVDCAKSLLLDCRPAVCARAA